jgi:hypothetical protein
LQGRKLPRSTTRLRQPGAISLHGAFFSEPREGLLKNLCGSYIWRHHYPVVHPLSVPARHYDSGVAQVGQVPGYLGLRLIQNLHEITDADFLISHEIQEPQPRIVAESLKEALHVETLILDPHETIIYVLTNVSRQQYNRLSAYVKGER